LCLAVAMLGLATQGYAQRGKSEFAVGYGGLSLYSYLNVGRNYNVSHSKSGGNATIAYRYYLTRDLTLGMGIGYENISNWGSFVSFVPEITMSYLDTRQDRIRLKLYGAFSYGVCALSDANAGPGHDDESGLKAWAFQATPLGVRVGRQWAGFLELGFGYKGLLHGGIALRVPRKLQHRTPKSD